MRIKFKPWAREELETCPFYIINPPNLKNKWKTAFENEQKLYLELGTGKGGFISKIARKNPNKNYIGVDLIDAMLGMCKRNIEAEFGIRKSTEKEYIENEVEKQKIIKNVLITRYDISRISDIFGEKDEIERIYINFCNPWPRGKHHKKRLTHQRQLEQYSKFLKGKIYFKTDDNMLFEDTLKYLERCNYKIEKVTKNLANENNFWEDEENIETEHEKMFKKEGVNIKGIIATMNDTKSM